MNKNQKIALGCGGAGCLGLIVVIIAVGVIWYLRSGSTRSTSGRNSPYNLNTNSNSNANVTGDASAETNENSGTSSTMSDDDKHKLYHAASATKDTDTMVRVWKKLGLTSEDGTPNANYTTFAREHIGWLFRNSDFIQEVNTEEKARAYVNAHIDD